MKDVSDSLDEDDAEDLDEVQSVSSALRPAQSHCDETNTSGTDQSGSRESATRDSDELDDLAPVSSSLRSGQERVRQEDANSGGGDD